MWLLPADFPSDAFDVPPGTWVLPWYAESSHIAALMDLMVAGEARISEWFPLPWSAVESEIEAKPPRKGAALVVGVPEGLSIDDARALIRRSPWPYVFLRSSRPPGAGEGAWMHRQLKPTLLSELHRSVSDPEHPLARFHVERLPLELLATLVSDPIDLLEIARSTVEHRVQHAEDGVRREDWESSLLWTTGWRVAGYLRRLSRELRLPAMRVLASGVRGDEDRAEFRRVARALESVGMGVLAGESFALSPLARAVARPRVESSLREVLSLPEVAYRGRGLEILRSEPMPTAPPLTRITTPAVDITDSSQRTGWLVDLSRSPKLSQSSSIIGELIIAMSWPRRGVDFRGARVIADSSPLPKEHRARQLRSLWTILAEGLEDQTFDLDRLRQKVTPLVRKLASGEARELEGQVDILLVERALLQSPDRSLLVQLQGEIEARAHEKPQSWQRASWSSIEAEVARLRGHSAAAVTLFGRASDRWVLEELEELEGRRGWLQARVSAASAAFEADLVDDAAAVLELECFDPSAAEKSTFHAKVALLRGLIAITRGSLHTCAEHLEMASNRFEALSDRRGVLYTSIAQAECHLRGGHLDLTSTLEATRQELGALQDVRGRTYAELVLGDASLLSLDLDKARACYREALRLGEHSGDDLARSSAYHKLAHLESSVRRYDIALEHERRALELEQEIELFTVAEQTQARIMELELLVASQPSSDR